MKIFLIRPKMVQEKSYEPPLGIAYLAAVLEKEGFHVEILDLVKEDNPGLIAKEIKNRKPDIIGIGFETENRWIGFETIKIAKSVLPNALVVAGGVHVSLTAENTLRNIGELDVIIRGEGEETLLELCKAVEGKEELGKIKGLSFRKGKDIVHNPDRAPIENLDSLPFPAYHLLLLKQYLLWSKSICSVITSRGCPYKCAFCSISAFWGNRCRVRSIPNVLEEIGYLVDKYHIKRISFRDDTFTLDKARTIQFCQSLIAARKKKGWNFSWGCNIRCDWVISKDLLAIMKEAGCTEVGTGIESGVPRLLSEMKKSIDLEQARNIVRWCGELGLKIYCVFMIGLPSENEDDFKKTLRLMDELKKIPYVRISAPSLLRIYPGTEIERLAYQQGILTSDFNWSKINNLVGVNGVPYFVKKNNSKEVNRFSEEVDILNFKLRLKYEGVKIEYFWNKVKGLKISSVKDINKYARKIAILIMDFFLRRKL